MRLILEVEVPNELATELKPFLDRNPLLWLGTQSGCSKHGYAVLVLRNKENRNGTFEELGCVLDQLQTVTRLIITGEAGG